MTWYKHSFKHSNNFDDPLTFLLVTPSGQKLIHEFVQCFGLYHSHQPQMYFVFSVNYQKKTTFFQSGKKSII